MYVVVMKLLLYNFVSGIVLVQGESVCCGNVELYVVIFWSVGCFVYLWNFGVLRDSE